ncbi:MAG: histidine kinase [Lachnospiraceae bacterium]|nr:histidine kinase [Lachnospiraceae bacterium]
MDLLTRIQVITELHGVICSAIIGVVLLFSKQKIYRGGRILAAAIFVNMWLLICDALAWLCRGSDNIYGSFLVRFSNYSVYFLEYMLVLIITAYIYSIVRVVNPDYSVITRRVIFSIITVDVLLLLSNPVTKIFFVIDKQNVYHRQPLFWLSMALAGSALLLVGMILFQNWKYLEGNERMEIIQFLLCPIVGAAIQTFYYGISFVNLGITISVFIAFVAYMRRLRKWQKERELVILKSQAYLLNSQIKPHFLFNSLNVIQSLIEEDPDTAVVAVSRFSRFLRTGLKLEIMDSMVPIQTELDYVDNYLYLETLRHGDKINIVRDFGEDLDFEVPFLTLQPIVENAVRHGICKRLKGGTVAIDIKKTPDGHLIRVVDDGVGFLPIEKEEKDWDPDEAAHAGVGSVNVRNRLAIMCGGTMEVDSVPGKGTMVTIWIPGK